MTTTTISTQPYALAAIQSRYLCPTNVRGSRYKATCQAGSVTVSSNDALDPYKNHLAAVEALKLKLNDSWQRPTVAGQLDDGSYVHVYPVEA